jgi:hypothetical protein
VRLDHLLSKELLLAIALCGGSGRPAADVGSVGVCSWVETLAESLFCWCMDLSYCLPVGGCGSGCRVVVGGGVSILLGPEGTSLLVWGCCFLGFPVVPSWQTVPRVVGVGVGVWVWWGCWLRIAQWTRASLWSSW